MEGLFSNFEVVTFLNNDVFLLTLPCDLQVGGLYQFDVATVLKMVTKDFFVTALILSGDLLPQGHYIFDIGQRAKNMHEARKLDPKAPYCPEIYLHSDKLYEAIPEAVVRRFASFCSYLQCVDGVFKNVKGKFEKIEDTSWDLSTL